MYTPRSAAFVAFSCGSLCSVGVGLGAPGVPAFLNTRFTSAAGARRFARLAACSSGRTVAVRAYAGLWFVDCPVFWRSSRLPGGGWAWPVSGGLRGLMVVLDSAGLPRPIR